MKTLSIYFVTMLVVALAAFAQTSPGDLVVDVPFTFMVAGETLPAGHYIVKDVDATYIRIFNSKTIGAFVPTHPAARTTSEESKLVFRCYGAECFFASVWVTGNRSGRELFPSAPERELAQKKTEMRVAVVRPPK